MKVQITIKTDRWSYPVYLNEDGEFRCPHEDPQIDYDIGGDGITEPGPSWGVYCYTCHNDDMRDHEIDSILENYWAEREDYDGDC